MKKIVILLALACFTLAAEHVPEHDTRNVVQDARTHFKMPDFANREAWLERAAFLRKQILSSAGLLPMLEKTPLSPQIFGRLERNGYSVEKVMLETYPGFYVGGNLYRPLGRQGPFPAVVSPHGHWIYGRLERSRMDARDLVSVPTRCINLARQGFVVFSHDMIGYLDTNQVPHHWGGPREALWSISPMGLQIWNSIRVVDFLTSLPDVDPNRIASTGASGGGTQTFLLTAVEDRISVAAPVNMISATWQGGVCENAPNLKAGATDISSVLIGALMAPRPLLIVSASGDWTRDTPNEEYPAIQNIYRLLGAEQNVETVQINALHNYNKESREAVYQFFNARLLGNNEPIREQNSRVEQAEDLLVLHNRLRPNNALNLEQLIDHWVAQAQRDTDRLQPRDASGLESAQQAFRERMTFSLLVSKPVPETVISEKTEDLVGGESLVLGRKGKGDRVPAVWLTPPKPNPRALPTLVVHPEGAAWTLTSARGTNGLVKGILNRGGIVLGIDAFQTGSARAPRDRDRTLFTSFNQTDDAHRVQDILTALEYLRSRTGASEVNLVGLGSAGVWSYFARAMADERVNLAADLAQFRAGTDSEYIEKFFVPGLRKAGDFRAAATLNARGKILLHNAGPEFPTEWARSCSQAAGATPDIRVTPASESEILTWLASETPRSSTQRTAPSGQ